MHVVNVHHSQSINTSCLQENDRHFKSSKNLSPEKQPAGATEGANQVRATPGSSTLGCQCVPGRVWSTTATVLRPSVNRIGTA
jgi:hypothetical protein